MLHTKTMQTLRVAQPVQQLSFLHRMPMYKLPLHQTPARSGKQTDSTAAGTVNANWPARGYRRRVVASSSAGDAVYNSKPESGKSNYWDCTFALTKAIIGAGMMPIPHAFNLLGWVAAVGMLVGVAAVTYWTNAVMVQGSADTGEGSYASLVGRLVGPAGAGLLQTALFGFCFGVMAVYLVVIGDILAGAPGAGNGLLSECFGITSGPLLLRSNVILAVAAAVCAPLVAIRDISKLSVFNILGVGAVILLAATAGLLGLTALITGTAHVPPAVPNLSAFGNTSLKITMGMAAVIPIILNCYVGHQSIHGIMTMLKPYSVKEMKAVCGGSLAMGCVIFLVLGLGSVAAFGAGVDANILNNLSATGMAPLIGSQLASVMSVIVRGGFLVSLLGSFALLMFPLRTCLIELLWNKQLAAAGSGPAKAVVTSELASKHYTILTYGILASTVATAVLVPDIWAALSIVGDLASTVQAFVVPALIGLALAAGKHLQAGKAAAALDGRSSSNTGLQKAMSVVVLTMGLTLFGNGILQRVLV